MKYTLLASAFILTISLAAAQVTKTTMLQTTSTVTTTMAASVAAVPDEDADRKIELVDRMATEQSYLYAQIVDKCFTFKLSPSYWNQLTDPTAIGTDSGIGAIYRWVGYTLEYCKRERIGDLTALSVGDPSAERQNRPLIDAMIRNLRSRFSLTIEAPAVCKDRAYELLLRYPNDLLERIGHATPEWSPKSGEAHFTITFNPTAKDIALRISADSKQFNVVAPAYTDVPNTANKLATSIEPVNKGQ